jgi:type VI secretion system secreted protein VgrG
MSLLAKLDITINRKPLKYFYRILINQNLYGIDTFEIECHYEALEEMDGFLIDRSKDFLGLPIVIQTTVLAEDEEKDGILFRGYVTKIQSSRSAMADKDRIIISGGSSEIALNRKPTNRAFLDKTLEEIAKEVLKKYEFKSKISPHNKERFPYIVQFEESDLEFLKRLAIRYGEWCFFDGQDFVFGEIPVVERPLTLGYSLEEFTYNLGVAPVKFTLFSLDPLKVDVHKYTSGDSQIEANLNMYGKHALKRSKKMYTEESTDYYEHLNVKESDYKKGLDQVGKTQEAADAVKLTSLSGRSTNGYLNAGMQVKVGCLKQDGKEIMDYGKYLVTSVQHEMDATLSYRNSFTAIPAEASIPENTNPYFVRTSSNQLGMVKDNQDPDKLGRVKISFWWMEGKQTTPWVKIVTPYVHKKAGFYFVPAKNSRVLVGFEDGDVEKPFCLGNLYDDDSNPDPDWAGNANESNAQMHVIRTASGNTIEFHDSGGEEKIRIYDAKKKNEITLDGANSELKIVAAETLTIQAKDIEIKADNGLKIEAGQAFEQKANQISTEAQSDVKIAGTNVEMKANASLKAQGNASAEVSASGTMTVKGALVQIN